MTKTLVVVVLMFQNLGSCGADVHIKAQAENDMTKTLVVMVLMLISKHRQRTT